MIPSMADFYILGVQISIENHPDAEKLELVKFGEFTCVAQKGLYKDGDVLIHIPIGGVIPDELMNELELPKNRIRMIKLRGITSEGVVCHPKSIQTIEIGKDYAEELNITKYIPPIPTELRGRVEPRDGLIKYDIENIQNYPNVLVENEEVVMTEKLHGTLCRITVHKDEILISSKGMGNKGLAFHGTVDNAYTRAKNKYIKDIEYIKEKIGACTIFGEVFGKGIQDFKYDNETSMRVFDIYKDGVYLPIDKVRFYLKGDLKHVPIVWRGLWDKSQLSKTVGKSLIPHTSHDREGVVIKPVQERRDDKFGRVILKSVSEQYLTRHEENPDATELS